MTKEEEYLGQIDSKFGWLRSQFITISPGQEATYILKDCDAKSYIKDGYPADASDYPMVKTEAEAFGLSYRETADNIVSRAAIWKNLASIFEGVRIKAKEDLRNAETDENKLVILNQTIESANSLFDQYVDYKF